MKHSICSLSEKAEHYYQFKSYSDEPAGKTAAAKTVRLMLSMLSENQRTVTELYWLEEMPADEIAKLLGITKKAVYNKLNRSRKRLRANLDFFVNS